MVAYTSFAIIGAGSLGTHVVSELLKQKVALKVLTRDDTKVRYATCVIAEAEANEQLLNS